MRENEKEREELKASSLKTLLMSKKKRVCYSDGWDFYTVPKPSKITKEPELITITRGAIQEDTKITAEKSKSQNSMNSGTGNGKFAVLQKFRSLAPFLFFTFCFSFLLVFDLQL